MMAQFQLCSIMGMLMVVLMSQLLVSRVSANIRNQLTSSTELRNENNLLLKECPAGFTVYEDKYCFLKDVSYMHTKAYTINFCDEHSATLPYPTGSADLETWQRAIAQVMDEYYTSWNPWIGASLNNDKVWVWLDGTPVPASAWKPEEPAGDEDCAIAWRTTGLIGDAECMGTEYVLCQATPTEAPTTTTTEATTTTGTSMCYSCIGCQDVDSADTNIVTKDADQSCFTAIYSSSKLVIRGVAPELHSDGECQIEESLATCYCNADICNAEYIPKKVTQDKDY